MYDKKTKYVVNETQKLYNLEYGEKHLKRWKMRNAHCRTWNIARNPQKLQKHTLGPGLRQEN